MPLNHWNEQIQLILDWKDLAFRTKIRFKNCRVATIKAKNPFDI